VAAGDSGKGCFSTNGISWSNCTLADPKYSIVEVAYGLSNFVAVGECYDGGYKCKVFLSPDGEEWEGKPLGTRDEIRLFGVASGNGRLVAVGGVGTGLERGGVFVSTDGRKWQETSVPSVLDLEAICFGNGLFVAVGREAILTSSDATAWEKCERVPEQWFQDVIFGDRGFVAVNLRGAAASSDGRQWEPQHDVDWLESVTWGNGKYVAIADSGQIYWSQNAVAWKSSAAIGLRGSSGVSQCDVAFGGGQFVAVGARGAAFSSEDAQVWTPRTEFCQTLRAVASNADRFVAVGEEGVIVSSTDTKAWKQTHPGPGEDLFGICHGRSQFVAVGKQGTILASVDGEDWTRRTSGTRESLRAVAYGGDQFVAVGEQGVIVASADGEDWKRCASATLQTLESVAYGNRLFVAVGAGSVVTSSDGYHWTAEQPPRARDADPLDFLRENSPLRGHFRRPDLDLKAVAFGSGRFVAVGDAGTILTSTDGKMWERETRTNPTLSFQHACFGDDLFVLVAKGGKTVVSVGPNGWGLRETPTNEDLHGVAWGHGGFVTVGQNGLVLRASKQDL